ncbi:MAG: hypothetical protein Q4E77_07755, partial [Conchiformibius sp.]|nr:hypothetical protein [Conchiformibius sp.]
MSQNDPKNTLIPLSNTAAAQLQRSKNLIALTRKVLQTGLAATGTALTKDDSWMEEIFAWADKFKIPETIVPRNKEALRAV